MKNYLTALGIIGLVVFTVVYIATPAPVGRKQTEQVTVPNYGFGTVERLNEPTILLNKQ